jgi:hypothetical protein
MAPYPAMHSINHEVGRQQLLVYLLFANGASRPAYRPLQVRVHVAQALIRATMTISNNKDLSVATKKSGLSRSCPASLHCSLRQHASYYKNEGAFEITA